MVEHTLIIGVLVEPARQAVGQRVRGGQLRVELERQGTTVGPVKLTKVPFAILVVAAVPVLLVETVLRQTIQVGMAGMAFLLLSPVHL